MRTYTVINPVPSLVGLLERSFAVMSWPISTFGGVVPALTDPVVLAAAQSHEQAIVDNRMRLSIPDDPANLPPLTSYPPGPIITYPGGGVIITP